MIIILFSLVGILLSGCTAVADITPAQVTPIGSEQIPTLTQRLPTPIPAVVQAASDNQVLAYLSKRGDFTEQFAELYTVHADGTHRSRLFSEREVLMLDLVSSPDGKQIAFWGCPGSMTADCYSQGDEDILAIDWGGGELRRLTGPPANEEQPDWSTDGQIVFLSDQSGSLQLYRMNSDGSNQRKLTDQPGVNAQPKWSPDGEWITFHNDWAGKNWIHVLSPEGEPAGEPLSGASPEWSPASLPGGLRLAFVCFQDGNNDICTARPDGSGLVNLTNSPFTEGCPAWSPDGNWLAFHVNNGRETYIAKVCTTCSEGAEPIRLTDASTPAGCPIWSPDGWQIAFLNVRDQGLWMVNADGNRGRKLIEGPVFGIIWRP